MKGFLFGVLALVFAVSLSLGVSAATEQLYTQTAVNFSRACRLTSANIQIVTATGSATGSTQTFNGGSAYLGMCTQDTYVRQTATVGATGFVVKGNAPFSIWAKAGDYMSVMAVASTGNCNFAECN